jgi:hypothetical protein
MKYKHSYTVCQEDCLIGNLWNMKYNRSNSSLSALFQREQEVRIRRERLIFRCWMGQFFFPSSSWRNNPRKPASGHFSDMKVATHRLAIRAALSAFLNVVPNKINCLSPRARIYVRWKDAFCTAEDSRAAQRGNIELLNANIQFRIWIADYDFRRARLPSEIADEPHPREFFRPKIEKRFRQPLTYFVLEDSEEPRKIARQARHRQ